MDDDGSKSLDLAEFKKGIRDYGLVIDDAVSEGCRLGRGAGGHKGGGRGGRGGWRVSIVSLLSHLQEAKAMFTEFDKDGSGTISFEEFLQKLRVSL